VERVRFTGLITDQDIKEVDMSKTAKATLVLLFILVLLSLGLNGFLLWQWLNFQQQVVGLAQTTRDMLSQTIVELDTFQDSTIQFELGVNQSIPIQAEIPFSQTLQVPIQTTIPITQNINTTVTVDIPELGVSLPLDVTVPLDMQLPVDLTVPISIDQTVPISTTVPVSLNAPISIKISETELAGYVEQLRAALVSIEKALSDVAR
jgi:hypothetical protein